MKANTAVNFVNNLELRKMRRMKSVDWRNLPNCPAIYIISDEEGVLYVGQTMHLILRFNGGHGPRFAKCRKTYIRWVELKTNAPLLLIEALCALRFHPKANLGYFSALPNNIGEVKPVSTRSRCKSVNWNVKRKAA